MRRSASTSVPRLTPAAAAFSSSVPAYSANPRGAVGAARAGAAGAGVPARPGGPDVPLALVDLRTGGLSGRQAEGRRAEIAIPANRTAVRFAPRPPMVTSGLRIGT
ncbi:hypothetical protein ARTB_21325, partial [Arthrobacter humicola]|nr:hypothetical protein [Arthrobacter humicola]